MKKILLYTGKGAYQAKDLENFLTAFDFDYQRICEHELNLLTGQKIFIVPGGKISDYLPTWKPSGINRIKNFVRNGGIYIGICAGAYVAGESYNNVRGLAFANQSLPYRRRIRLTKAQSNTGKKFDLLSENGPDLTAIAGETIIRGKNGEAQAVKIDYGKGQIYLFSSNPEGSICYNLPPKKFSGAKFFSGFLKQI